MYFDKYTDFYYGFNNIRTKPFIYLRLISHHREDRQPLAFQLYELLRPKLTKKKL